MAMLSTLTKSGHQPNLHILDNEASYILKQGLLKHKIQYQLVPPHLHICNVDEPAIQTKKEISSRVSVQPTPTIMLKSGIAFYHKQPWP